MRTIPYCICTVIPPHIMSKLAKSGNADMKRNVAETMEQTADFREERDAAVGDAKSAAAFTRRNRLIYDALHAKALPGELIIQEGELPPDDVEVVEAYEGSGATYDFFMDVFKRSSVDGKGGRLISSVHYGVRFDNAMWNGRQMIYGDGDGTVFNRFTAALDVIAHELTHGVVQHTASLGYTGQTGAVNEHVADVFGILVKQYRLRQTADTSDWIIGGGLLGPKVHGVGVRSMAAPGTAYDDPLIGRDPQPAHMRNYVVMDDDHGGVHINSGILNHAFYLLAMAIGGNAWEVAGRIWYRALTTKIAPTTNFQSFASATYSAASELYGPGSSFQRAVASAWAAVGLPVRRSAAPRIPIKREKARQQRRQAPAAAARSRSTQKS